MNNHKAQPEEARSAHYALITALAAILVWPLTVWNQDDIPPAGDTEVMISTPAEELAAKRGKLAEELAATQRILEVATADGAKPPPHILKETEFLQEIELTLSQQEAEMERAKELKASMERLEVDLATQRSAGPSEERPDSFLLLEAVRSKLKDHGSFSIQW